MTETQKAAFVNAQAAMMNAEVSTLTAANMVAFVKGEVPPFGKEEFQKVLDKYEETLNCQKIIELFNTPGIVP